MNKLLLSLLLSLSVVSSSFCGGDMLSNITYWATKATVYTALTAGTITLGIVSGPMAPHLINMAIAAGASEGSAQLAKTIVKSLK